MKKLKFEYIPLTFINDQEEIKNQIRNTIILIYLFDKYNLPIHLEELIEGTQYGYNASALQSGLNKFLRISDIFENKVKWDTVPFCNCEDEETYLLKKNDILIARTGGTTGKSFKIDFAPEHSIYAGYLIRIRAKQNVNSDYIDLFLHSFAYWSQIVNLNERKFRPKANAENLKSLVLPNCDRNIQDEAVALAKGERLKGYEELNSKIEKVIAEYEKSQKIQLHLTDQLTQLTNLNQAILQEAVQGKLVPQNPADEPATELLKRIKAEKEKSGKKDLSAAKAEKPLPPIKPEEIPFEIPDSWVWCRLGEIALHNSGKTLDGGRNKGILRPYITTSNLYWGYFVLENLRQMKIEDNEDERCLAIKGDLLVCEGGEAGRTAIWQNEEPVYFQNHIHRVRPYLGISSKYLYYYMKKIYVSGEINNYRKGMGIKNLSGASLSSIIIPLPPLSVQRRIVAEIEKQFAKTKQLKENIIANQQGTEQLLKALLAEAFEGNYTKELKKYETI